MVNDGQRNTPVGHGTASAVRTRPHESERDARRSAALLALANRLATVEVPRSRARNQAWWIITAAAAVVAVAGLIGLVLTLSGRPSAGTPAGPVNLIAPQTTTSATTTTVATTRPATTTEKVIGGSSVDPRAGSTPDVITVETTFVFPRDAEALPVSLRPELDRLVALMTANPRLELEVTGHTDSSGSASYNMSLSESRAEAVVDYLVQAGIDRSRLTAIGRGETEPVADNSTAAGRALNRRIEIRTRGL